MTPLQALVGIAVACIVILLLIVWFAPEGWEDDAGFHVRTPSPCERDEYRASDVNAELDGGRLPAGMINLNHNEGINS